MTAYGSILVALNTGGCENSGLVDDRKFYLLHQLHLWIELSTLNLSLGIQKVSLMLLILKDTPYARSYCDNI